MYILQYKQHSAVCSILSITLIAPFNYCTEIVPGVAGARLKKINWGGLHSLRLLVGKHCSFPSTLWYHCLRLQVQVL